MSDYNQTDEIEPVDLDGTEYLLILKDGELKRISIDTILEYGVLNNIVAEGTPPV